MRCGRCNCLFPARWPAWARLARTVAALSVFGVFASLVYPYRTLVWSTVSNVCRNNPLLTLAVGAVMATALLIVLVVTLYPTRRR
jgi:hypothetical protein